MVKLADISGCVLYLVSVRKLVRNEDFQGVVIFCKPFTPDVLLKQSSLAAALCFSKV